MVPDVHPPLTALSMSKFDFSSSGSSIAEKNCTNLRAHAPLDKPRFYRNFVDIMQLYPTIVVGFIPLLLSPFFLMNPISPN